jgi:murein L,D-transpeptidase YafK
MLRSGVIKNLKTAILTLNEKVKNPSNGSRVQKASLEVENVFDKKKAGNTSLLKKTNPVVDTVVKEDLDKANVSPTIKVPAVDPSLYVFDYSAHPVFDSTDYLVLVANKAKHILYVLQRDKPKKWKTVRTYYIAIGAQQGQKVNAGDKKTPEGFYLLIDRKESYQLMSMYGPLVYILDYPNSDDRAAGRTGQGIWIHGTEKDSIPFETKGCLEMNNSDLIEMSTLLKSGKGTPIFIVYDSLLKNPEKLIDTDRIALRRKEFFNSLDSLRNVDTTKVVTSDFEKFVQDWQDAWESQDIEKYSNFYFQSRFTVQGMDWTGWKEKKIQTFKLYDTIDVSYNKFIVSNVTDSTAVVRFSQAYQTEKVRFQNNKQLNLEKEQGMWKITREAAF